MATIKIYSSNSDDDSIEVFNEGAIIEGEVALQIDHQEHPADYLWFHLTKEDAIELIKYLKVQLSISNHLIA